MKTLPQIAEALKLKRDYWEKRGKKWNPKVPPILHPTHIERRYTKDLQKSYTILFELVKNGLLSNLPSLAEKNAKELATRRFDSADSDVRAILQGISIEFSRKLTQNEIKYFAQRRGLEVSAYNLLQNKKIYMRLLDIDVYSSEPWLTSALEAFANENAALITTLSNKHIAEVRNVVVNGFREGVSGVELARLIKNKVNARTRANYKLIARDQISKLNGQLTMLRQRDVGVEQYTWRTSRDERVRDSHRANADKMFRWEEPPSDTGHPGQDFQCRCYAEPDLTGLIYASN